MNSSVELEPALLDLVEHDLRGHQLGEARRRNELVGALFEQHAAAVGIDQDRVRGRGLEPVAGLGARHRIGSGEGSGQEAERGCENEAEIARLRRGDCNQLTNSRTFMRIVASRAWPRSTLPSLPRI